MRYTQYIAAFVAFIFATACTIADVDNTINVSGGDNVTVMGRITRFTDKDVTSRASKDPQTEGNLYNMAVALFRIENGVIGKCDFFEYKVGSEVLFTIDRKIKDGNNYIYLANNHYAMYIFANCAAMEQFETNDEYKTTSLETMKAVASSVSNLDIPVVGDNVGFPMMGSLGDYITAEGDGKTFILKPGTDDVPTLPQISDKKGDMVETDLLTIPLQALFSKINFTIKVTPDQTVEDNPSPRFTLDNYSVNNVPTSVAFGKDLNTTAKTDTVANDAVATYSNIKTVTSLTNYAMGASTITFSFYIPERYLTPQTESKDYNYPFGTLEDGDKDENNNGIRDEDEKYRQRFKPLLPSDSQKATYVTITGTFRDHQNHSWDVTYDIYLGENNYSDFNIKRNCEYNNYITIRGIQASDDMSDNLNGVAIDHRVNVERTQPAIISLRREVLLDSHFEVRPLRVRKSDIGDVGNINAVKVEVVNPTTTNWMRIERSFGDGSPAGSPETTVNGVKTSIYIDDDSTSPSYGKRKFFTYNLIDGVNANATDATLKDSFEVILPLTNDTECCWIYIDECSEVGDAVRAGIIRVTYGNLNGNTFTGTTNSAYPVINYIINQRKLFQVTASGRTYNIEYEEEYLHNFDADDSYGQTEEEGMQWGLPNIQLSYDHQSISFNDGLQNWLTSGSRPYYDFYINKYDSADATLSKGTLHSYEGFNFCSEIIQVINGQDNHDTDSSNNIDVLQLDEKPESAVEYCYNKNKRNNQGQVASTGNTSNLKWYLPAIDEMEDIIVSEYGGGKKSYSRFEDFQDNFYWSCQPAFIKNFAYYGGIVNSRDAWGPMYIDNTNAARATKVNYLGNNQFDYARSGLKGEKDSNDNEIYYNAYYYAWGGLLGTTHYTPTNGTVTIDSRVTITLQELDTQIQEGYHPRTKKNRVRCVRKVN